MSSCFGRCAFGPQPPSWKPYHGYRKLVSTRFWQIDYRANLQNGRACQVTTVTEIGSGHHVLRVVHLLSQLWNGDSTERVCATTGQRSKSNHEEMETGEGNHVDGELAKIGV